MPLRLHQVLVLSFILFLPISGNPLPASEGIYLPPSASLPEVVCSFPGGRITRKDFLNAVLRACQTNTPGGIPYFIQVQPSGFLPFILQDLLIKQQNITGIDDETKNRLGVLAKEAGGNEKFDENLRRLSRAPLSRDDFYRQLRRQVREEMTGYNLLPPRIKEDKFHPRWYGTSQPVAASAGGIDFTSEDVANFLVLEAADTELDFILNELLHRQIILAEAAKMDSNKQSLSEMEALELIFAPLLSDAALAAFFQSKETEYTVYKVREFVFRDRLAAGQPASGDPSADARSQALALTAELNANTAEQNVTRLSTGQSRFYYQTEIPAGGLPPEAYGVDYLYAADGSPVNPFSPVPEAMRQALSKLVPGKALAPQAIPGGWVVLYCEVALTPKMPGRLLPALRKQRLLEQSARLLEAVRQKTEFRWRPGARLDNRQRYPALRDPTPAGAPALPRLSAPTATAGHPPTPSAVGQTEPPTGGDRAKEPKNPATTPASPPAAATAVRPTAPDKAGVPGTEDLPELE